MARRGGPDGGAGGYAETGRATEGVRINRARGRRRGSRCRLQTAEDALHTDRCVQQKRSPGVERSGDRIAGDRWHSLERRRTDRSEVAVLSWGSLLAAEATGWASTSGGTLPDS